MLASFCGICGLQFQPNEIFCSRCGASRDANVSDTTALLAAPPNAPVIIGSNPQTFCINCGQPRPASQSPCPFCGTSAPTIQTLMPIAPQLATDLPTPPLAIKDLISQQIYAATVGITNPYGYGLWGDLVVDGSKQNPWNFPDTHQRGTDLWVETNSLYIHGWGDYGVLSIPGIDYQDVAVQAIMEVDDATYPGSAGIACRIDEKSDIAFCLIREISHEGVTKNNRYIYVPKDIYAEACELIPTNKYSKRNVYGVDIKKAFTGAQ